MIECLRSKLSYNSISWDNVTELESGIFIEFLKKKYQIENVENAVFEKIDENTIKIKVDANEEYLLSRYDDKTKVKLTIKEDKLIEFKVKKEDNVLKIIIPRKYYKENIIYIGFFFLLGFGLKFCGFDFDKESYESLFITMATMLVGLVGFTGIFSVLLYQKIQDKTNRLIELFQKLYDNEILISKLYSIKDLDDLEKVKIEIETKIEDLCPKYSKKLEKLKDFLKQIIKTKKEIIYNPSNPSSKNTFLFVLLNLIILMVPIAFNHIYLSNDNFLCSRFGFCSIFDTLSSIFDALKWWKMPLTGLVFGLNLIAFKDLTAILMDVLFKKL